MQSMTAPVVETPRIPAVFQLDSHRSRFAYFFLALVVVLAVRMLENTIHEYSHVAAVLLSGGEIVGLPLVTPFGGFTSWRSGTVPGEWLPVVNIAGTLVSVAVMLAAFLPVYLKAKRPWARWLAYWGACVVPVNSLFYWFAAPFIATAENYDPVAFANNLGISPAWIIGVVAAAPFFVAVAWMVKATRQVRAGVILDPKKFHLFCLALYYAISITFPVVSYLNLLDQFAFW
ncbi:MAG: hypothetical protein JW839_22010 [Candidatus Lokiarchaeota archaeon]|nr:hypothetical protein [Candidatus Lokiarchaeota archaeon]